MITWYQFAALVVSGAIGGAIFAAVMIRRAVRKGIDW